MEADFSELGADKVAPERFPVVSSCGNELMKTAAISLFLVTPIGCGEKTFDIANARVMADERFKAHAVALGEPTQPIPTPSTRERADDSVFVYSVGKTGKKVTVIVDRHGQLADTVE